MKKFWKSVLYAAGFFGLYLGTQFLVVFAYAFSLGIQAGISIGTSNVIPDFEVMFAQITEQLLGASTMLSSLSGILLLAILFILFLARKKSPFREMGFRPVSPICLLPLLLLGACATIVLVYLLNLLPESLLMDYMDSAELLSRGSPFWSILATVVVAPLVEEIIFRGLMFSRLRRGMPVFWAAAAVSVFFALMHGHMLWISYAFILGILLIYTAWKFNSTWASLAIHFAFNGANIVLGYMTLDDTMSLVLLIAAGAGLIASFVWLVLQPGPAKPIAPPAMPPLQAESAPAKCSSVPTQEDSSCDGI